MLIERRRRIDDVIKTCLKKIQLLKCCASLTWWSLRGGCTRSHSEHGRETPLRQWYFVSRRGRVGRCQVCKTQQKIFSKRNRRPLADPKGRSKAAFLLCRMKMNAREIATKSGAIPSQETGCSATCSGRSVNCKAVYAIAINPFGIYASRTTGPVAFYAGWSSPVARQAHNLKVIGSNPIPATNFRKSQQ